jgi:transcriptional regulator with XRE-family HTH domain
VPADLQDIGQRLRAERRALELSIPETSRLSGVNRNLISQIERGMVPSSIVPIERLASALGVTLDE